MSTNIRPIALVLLLLGVSQAGAQYPDYYGDPTYQGAPPAYYGAPGYRRLPPPDRAGRRWGQGSLRIEKGLDETGYTLIIHTGERSPEGIEVIPRGNSLVIGSQSIEMQRKKDRGGYSYSRQWGSSSRNIRLPRDADINGMVRTDGEGVINISIPRTAPRY